MKIDCRQQSESGKMISPTYFVARVLTLLYPLFSDRTLLRLHNIRAVILLLMCLTTACEIGSLLMTRSHDGRSPYGVESALFVFMSITSSAMLLRIIEVRKSKSGEKI